MGNLEKKYNNLTIIKFNKFIRFDVKELEIEDLYKIFFDSNFNLYFGVFLESKTFTRYKIKKPETADEFIHIISFSFKKEKTYSDSGDIDIFDCIFLDAYTLLNEKN